MKRNKQFTWTSYQQQIELFFIAYIIIQPILDVFAYIDVLPISNMLRILAMGIGFVYICIYPNHKIKKQVLIFLGVLATYLAIHFVNNLLVKDPFYLIQEIINIVKSVYFVEILIVYLFVLSSISKRLNWQHLIQRNVFISMSIIGIVMLLASLTGTGERSYGSLAKQGHSGWFFSGNDLSAILAMGFGLMVMYMMNKDRIQSKLLLLPFIIIAIWSAMTVGTKVGFGGVVIVLGVAIVVALFTAVKDRKGSVVNIIILSSILILSFVAVPSTPIGNNLNLTADKLSSVERELEENIDNNEENIKDEVGEVEEEPAKETRSSIIFSGRDNFTASLKTQYNDAPISQKVLGMGLGGNYKSIPRIAEMDLFDLFFSYGVIGFLLFLMPILVVGLIIIKNIFSLLVKAKLNINILIVGVAVCLGLGTSVIAGHVMLTPSSSIYLALVISYLYLLAKAPTKA